MFTGTSIARLACVFAAVGAARSVIAQSSDEPLTAVGAVQLSRVAVRGSTVFTDQELQAITAPFETGLVTFESLQQLRHELSQQYIERVKGDGSTINKELIKASLPNYRFTSPAK